MMKKLFLFAGSIFCLNISGQTISGGNAHALAVCSDNTVRAWGSNLDSALGNGSNTNSNVPVQVNSLTGVISVSAGLYHTAALKNNGTVWTWGNGYSGQLGNGVWGVTNTPVQASGLTGITAIAGGGVHTLALKNDSTVWSWGYNGFGQLGDGTNTDISTPVHVVGLTGIIAIAADRDYSMALKSDGTVWMWGRDYTGLLGNGGSNTDSNVPVQTSVISGIIAIAGGGYHALALKNDGTVWTWGYNLYGNFGDGTTGTASNVPVQITALSGITGIAGGGYYSLFLKNDGTVWGCGQNGKGQIGNGSVVNSAVPAQANSLTGVTAIATGWDISLALKNDGTLWSFGNNGSGQLGNGSTATNSSTPVQVTSLCTVSGIEQRSQMVSVSVSVFPNPSTGMFQISIAQTITEFIQLKITDVLGNEVYVEKFANTGTDLILDLSHLQNGIYFLHTGNVATQKIIISR
jgi:alpha-tubulin suppressor-like RCC1 family protein